MSEVQTLRQELADTQKKLQGYADTVISLYNELRILKENICNDCKEKFAPNSTGASSSFLRSSRLETPAEPTNFWRRILKGKHPKISNGHHAGSVGMSNVYTTVDSISANTFLGSGPSKTILTQPSTEKSHFISGPTSVPLSEAVTSDSEASSVPRWSAKQDAVNATVSFVFVRSFTHKERVWSARFSGDGKYLAAALLGINGGSLVIFDVETGEQTCALAEYASKYSSKRRPGIQWMCFTPNGRFLVTGDLECRVIVWDTLNKRLRNTFRGHGGFVESVDFSPNGQLVVSASWDGTVRTWSMRDGSAMIFNAEAANFWSVRFSPNGRYVAAGDSVGILRIWDVRSGLLVKKLTHKGGIRSVAYTPDGRGLLSGSDTVQYWDVSSDGMVPSGGTSEIVEYKGHTDYSNCVAVSPDARWVASASDDETVIIWNTLDAVRQCTLIGHEHTVYSVDFSPAGLYLATGGGDGHVTLWRYHGM